MCRQLAGTDREVPMLSYIPVGLLSPSLGTIEMAMLVALIPIVIGIIIGLRRETSVILSVLGAVAVFYVQ